MRKFAVRAIDAVLIPTLIVIGVHEVWLRLRRRNRKNA